MVPAAFVRAQIQAVTADIGVDAVKVGMLATAEIVEAVADELVALACPVVVDPVMVANIGARLLDEDAVDRPHRRRPFEQRHRLRPRVSRDGVARQHLLRSNGSVASVVSPHTGASISADGHTALVTAGAKGDPTAMVAAADTLKSKLHAAGTRGRTLKLGPRVRTCPLSSASDRTRKAFHLQGNHCKSDNGWT